MCIRDRRRHQVRGVEKIFHRNGIADLRKRIGKCEVEEGGREAVSYTHLRAHETVLDLVCRLLLETKQELAFILHEFVKDTQQCLQCKRNTHTQTNTHRRRDVMTG